MMSYGYPPAGYDPRQMPPPGSVWNTSLKVRWPAIGLASVAGLNLGFCLIMMVASLQIVVPAVNQARQPTTQSSADGASEHKSSGGTVGGYLFGRNLVVSLIWLTISAFASGMILVGSQKMRKVESYFTSVTIAVVALIPGLSPLCVAGIPFGIWALMVLLQPDVRYTFRGRA